jgi:hypothetical protein
MNKYLEKIARSTHFFRGVNPHKSKDEQVFDLAMNIKGKYGHAKEIHDKYNEKVKPQKRHKVKGAK